MNEMQIYRNIMEVFDARMKLDFQGFRLLRNNQATIQGVPTGPTVFMTVSGDKRVGFPRTDMQLKQPDGQPPSQVIPTDTVQVIESRLQFMGLAPVSPETDGQVPTAIDVLRRLAMYFSADAIIGQLQARGLNVMRIIDVRTPWFENDHDTFQSNPTFEVIVQHQDNLRLDVRAIDYLETELHRI